MYQMVPWAYNATQPLAREITLYWTWEERWKTLISHLKPHGHGSQMQDYTVAVFQNKGREVEVPGLGITKSSSS